MKAGRLSAIALWISLICIVIIRLFVADNHGSLSWDVFGYYLYLPAFFIYQDPTITDLSWVNGLIEKYNLTATFYQAIQIESGNWVMRYPGGLALLNLPGFLLADLLAEPLGFLRDGFSEPYQYAWILTGLAYSIAGMFFARKVLSFFFNDKINAILLVLIAFGTNYLWLATYGNPLTHGYLFSLFAIGLFVVIRLRDNPKLSGFFVLGWLIGLITMIRPNEGLFLLPAMLLIFLPKQEESFWSRQFYWQRLKPALLVGLGLLAGGLPQMLYWKFAAGKFLFYSYQDNGVGFDLMNPHTVDFLFSFRKGWYVYTPVMLLATIGFIPLFKHNKTWFYPLFIFFLLNLYVVSSWSVWWYAGGSYSSRAMVSTYVLMAIPLGYLLKGIAQQSFVIRSLFSILLVFFVLLNCFQFWQYKKGIIHGERMTAAYYFKVFGKTSIPDGAEKLLLVERPVEAYETMPNNGEGLLFSLLEENYLGRNRDLGNRVELELPDGSTEWVLKLDEENPFSMAIEKDYLEVTQKEYAWLRVSADVFVPAKISDEPPLLVVQFNHKEKPYKYTTTEPQGDTLTRGAWQTVALDYMTPEVRSKEDRLKVYLWYRGKNPVYARKIRIEKYEPE